MKAEHQIPSGLLQSIMIPEWKWDRVTMDFVSGLPLTPRKKDTIWVGSKVYTEVLEEIARSFRQKTAFQYSFSSANIWSIRVDHSDSRRYVKIFFQSSIKMAPYEALYGRKCRTPLYWTALSVNKLHGVDLIKYSEQKVKLIRDCLKATSDRQKSYADLKRKDIEFEIGDKVFLKVSSWKKVLRFRRKGKLSPRFIGPYEVIERVGPVAYRLRLPSELEKIRNVFHISMLRRYRSDPSHVITPSEIEIRSDMTYEEEPICILARKVKYFKYVDLYTKCVYKVVKATEGSGPSRIVITLLILCWIDHSLSTRACLMAVEDKSVSTTGRTLSSLGGQPGIHVTKHRISSLSYLKGLSKDGKRWIRECVAYQRCKADNSTNLGLLQPLPIPERAWTAISMDFVEGLPTSKGKSTILVVVDRLTKYGHFFALAHPFTELTGAKEYLIQIYKVHGIPESIISERDRIFLSNIWQELFRHLCSKLQLSIAYHPQIDGQIEILNKCLEGYLRCMISEKPFDWVTWLPLAEWWYNNTYHSTIKTTPYEAFYGQDLPIHLPYLAGASQCESTWAVDVHDEAVWRRENNSSPLALGVHEGMLGEEKSSAYPYSIVHAFLDLGRINKEAMRKLLKFHFTRAQDRVKQLAEKRRSEREFNVVGASILSPVGSDGSLLKEPIRVLDRRMVKKGNQTITETLVDWADKFSENSTWENLKDIQLRFPIFDQ
ncbi:reverse transcriptase [Gossypium australe]|uniref:Reverse transcriptase n=1 Tax=Gossypium australe TaxID=47621 RepID=A0A5B6WGG9_9ROSI|nr:reverse transcriptase [Gossypium australe]